MNYPERGNFEKKYLFLSFELMVKVGLIVIMLEFLVDSKELFLSLSYWDQLSFS